MPRPHPFLLRFLPASALLLGASSAGGRVADPPADSLGRPLFDSRSQPLFYDAPGIGPTASEPSTGMVAKALAAEPSGFPASPGGSPFWSYGVFGTQIGLAGLLAVPGSEGTELIVSATANGGFGANNFWYVLSHDPVSGGYQQVHVHPPYEALPDSSASPVIAAIVTAQVAGGPEPELIVGLKDGRFHFHTPSTLQEIATLRPVTGLNDFAAADLTGDGVAELIVLTDSGVTVFNPAGDMLWSVEGPNGRDLVVAQMDTDPALEIATTSGHVIDAKTRKVQWSRSTGFGAHLRAADIDGDGRDELIAAQAWYQIHAFDVDTEAAKWSYPAALDISTIEIGNVDADPAPELIYGDGQHGSVHVLTLGATTPVEKWSVPNPDSGIPRIAIIDADDDGTAELIWAGGSNTTGQDRLNVVNPATRQTEWQSIHLDGPFVSPALGDVTGDGLPELVTASWESESGYSSGRILVFDPVTLALLGISDPIAGNRSWTGLRDLRLRDVEGDGRLEIVIAADWLYDGIVEIYRFTDARSFELEWTNTARPSGEPYSQVEVLDVDGDGDLEVVAGNDRAHTGSTGTYVTVIDYATRSQEWRSPGLGGSWNAVTSLAVADVNGDGRMEAVAASPGIGLRVFDLQSRTEEWAFGSECRAVSVRPGETGFDAGFGDGSVRHFEPDRARGYVAAASWQASAEAISGLTPGAGESLWISAGHRISLWPDRSAPVWATGLLGSETGRVALLETEDGLELYAGLSHGIGGFKVGGMEDSIAVRLESSGTLTEGSLGKVTLTFTRSGSTGSELPVIFNLTGSAAPEEDFAIAGATSLGGTRWSVTLPPGWKSATVTLTTLQDEMAEETEFLQVGLEPSPAYFLGSPHAAEIFLEDDESTVSVTATDATASELRGDAGEFTLRRVGGLSRPLRVRFSLTGTAAEGSDFAKTGGSVVFPKGRDTVVIKLVPKHDGEAEPEEDVFLSLLAASDYSVSEAEPEARMTIQDGEPQVSIVGANALRGSVAVDLRRSGGHKKPLTVQLFVTYEEADGSVRVRRQRASFHAGAETARVVIRPSARVKGPARVTVELSDTGEFHRGDHPSVSFDLPPAAPDAR